MTDCAVFIQSNCTCNRR